MMLASDNTSGAFHDNNNRIGASSSTTTSKSSVTKILNNTELQCSPILFQSNSSTNNALPSKRWGHTSNIVNDMMYTIAGYTGSEKTSNSNWKYLNDINIYSCKHAFWQTTSVNSKDPSFLAPSPSVRSNHASCSVGNRYIVVIAGSGKDRSDQQTSRFGDIHVLDTLDSSFGWLKCDVKSAHKNTALAPRTYHAACLMPGGVIAIFGGYTGTVDLQDVVLVSMNQILKQLKNENAGLRPQVNTVEGTLSSVMESRPFARRFHTLEAMEYGKAGILFGGCSGKNYECFNDVWILRHTPKSTNISWTEVHPNGTKPTKRWGHSSTAVGLHMIIVGGRSKHDIMDFHVLSFVDITLNQATWSSIKLIGPKPTPRRRHTCCRYKDKILLFGGFDGKAFLNDMHTIHLSNEIMAGCNMEQSSSTMNQKITARQQQQALSAIPKRLSVSEAFAFVDDDNDKNNKNESIQNNDSGYRSSNVKFGDKEQDSVPSLPFVVNQAFPPPPPADHNCKVLTDSSTRTFNDAIVCKDGYALDGLTREDRDLVRFFCPYFKFMNYEVIMTQLVRLKAELGEKEMTEQIIQRLLPTAVCMTSSKEIGVELILKLIVVEGMYATLSLALPGRENDLIEKLNNLFQLKQNIDKSNEIIDEKSMMEYATTQGWNQSSSEIMLQMMQMGYSEVQLCKCYQYVSHFLKTDIGFEAILDNIEKVSQIDIGVLFRDVKLPNQNTSNMPLHVRSTPMSTETSCSINHGTKTGSSTSYSMAQQLREQEIKINSMEDVLEEVLTCCITQEIMIDPVATVDGNVYERRQIEQWLLKSGGTDPLTRKKVKLSELIPLRNLRDAAEKFRKMQL
jgi:hypothetical protein